MLAIYSLTFLKIKNQMIDYKNNIFDRQGNEYTILIKLQSLSGRDRAIIKRVDSLQEKTVFLDEMYTADELYKAMADEKQERLLDRFINFFSPAKKEVPVNINVLSLIEIQAKSKRIANEE